MACRAGQIDGWPRADYHHRLMQAHYPVRDIGRGEKRQHCHGSHPGQEHPPGQALAHRHLPRGTPRQQTPLGTSAHGDPLAQSHRDRRPMLGTSYGAQFAAFPLPVH
jgi:hypothetical protein